MHPELKMVLHTDQGAVYASKSLNELLPLYNIVHSMSRVGTPTDNLKQVKRVTALSIN